jgi:hypothetical protein
MACGGVPMIPDTAGMKPLTGVPVRVEPASIKPAVQLQQ